MPCQVWLASSGSRTWKLKRERARPATIIASGIHSSGVARTWRQRGRAARPWRARRRAATLQRAGSIAAQREQHRAERERVDARSRGRRRRRAITAAAAAGPAMRAVWTITQLSATALTIRSGPTSSITKAWRAGLSMALTSAARENERVDHPELDRARRRVSPHSASAGMRHQRLGDHQQPPLAKRGRRAGRPRRRTAASAGTAARR